MRDATFEPTPRRGPCPHTQLVCPAAVYTKSSTWILSRDFSRRMLGYYCLAPFLHVMSPSSHICLPSLHTLLPPRVSQGHDIMREDAVQTGRQLTRLLPFPRPGSTDTKPLFREAKTLPQNRFHPVQCPVYMLYICNCTLPYFSHDALNGATARQRSIRCTV
jgi:hypothetical protein